MSALLFVSILPPAAVSHQLLKTSELAQSALDVFFPFQDEGAVVDKILHWPNYCWLYLDTGYCPVIFTMCFFYKHHVIYLNEGQGDFRGSKSGEVLSDVTEVTGRSSRRSMQCVIKARPFL